MAIIDFLKENNIPYKENVLLSNVTGMNLRGELPLIAYPISIKQLSTLYIELIKSKITYEIVGGLTNTYLCEGFSREILVITTHVKDIIEKKNLIIVGCGYGLSSLSKRLTINGFKHFSGLVGIPGTIGAAAINNSGAFSDSISDIVQSVSILDHNGNLVDMSADELCYSPRNSKLKGTQFGVLLSVTLNLSKSATPEYLIKKMEDNQRNRKENIDGSRKSLGSIVAGYTINRIWEEHRIANIFKKIIYTPFKKTKYRKKILCFSEFFVLGNLRFIKHCDNIGRFCWEKDTTEKDFMDYLSFLKKKSKKIVLEIDIKK